VWNRHVEVAGEVDEVLQRSAELPGGLVGEDLLAAGCAQCVLPRLRVLIMGADPGDADSHGLNVSQNGGVRVIAADSGCVTPPSCGDGPSAAVSRERSLPDAPSTRGGIKLTRLPAGYFASAEASGALGRDRFQWRHRS
jgi:hypothetical protein